MPGGVKISYISGAGDQAEAQQLLDGIVATDQLSYYSLNISKSQLLSLINEYDNGIVPDGWTVGTRSNAGKIVNQIDAELSILGERQNEIMSDPDVQVSTGYDPQFADFIGVNGVTNRHTNLCPPMCDAYFTNPGYGIGVIPVVVIVAAIIVGGAVLYELIQWLEVLTVESDAQVEQSEILKKAAMDLTPADQKAYWNDIQRQLNNAYQSGFAAGNDGSLFGDAAQFATVAVIGIGLLMLPRIIGAVTPSRPSAAKQISGIGSIKALEKLANDKGLLLMPVRFRDQAGKYHKGYDFVNPETKAIIATLEPDNKKMYSSEKRKDVVFRWLVKDYSGAQSVLYYTENTSVAAKRLNRIYPKGYTGYTRKIGTISRNAYKKSLKK